VSEKRPGPAVLEGLLGVPEALGGIFETFDQQGVVNPGDPRENWRQFDDRQFSNRLLENCQPEFSRSLRENCIHL